MAKTTPPDVADLPISADEPESIRSRRALMLAQSEKLLTYRWPFDTRTGTNVDKTLTELSGAPLPPEAGIYYFVWINTVDPRSSQAPGGGDLPAFVDGEWKTVVAAGRAAVFIPEGEVKPFVLALAVMAGKGTRFQYREGMLPGQS